MVSNGEVPGSSPLTRGKQHSNTCTPNPQRLIPAHAGKTPPRKPPWTSTWAHPRSRGENRGVRPGLVFGAGSSPLTRGKRSCRAAQPCRRRLIPAHAGKTRFASMMAARSTAHPRSRGENERIHALLEDVCGSSPLTRGKLQAASDVSAAIRLIPAHAGKTGAGDNLTGISQAHPRSRGENRRFRRSYVMGFGSSPLTRGKPS